MKRFAVLGLGPSIHEFTPSKDIETIGCNDIWKIYRTTYLVCVDPKRVFSPERLKVIENSLPLKMFSYLPEWENNFAGYFQLLHRASPRSSLMHIDDFSKVHYSICSPYVACIVAYQLGAKEITLYGVDFTNHQHINSESKLGIIQRDFTNLFNELKKKKVNLYAGTKNSFLSSFIPVSGN